ncbi:MAG: 2-oxoglutarate dehydrogenase complex dihydrolipoyllysine-residue succinyltransferase, partial [Saprospiraceae bacterium]
MAIIEIKVPAIGESITEVTLGKWLRNDGDIVAVDDPICEFESDKANMELPAEAAGKLTRIAKEGDDLAIGALIATIDTTAAAGSPAPKPSASAPAAEKPIEVAQKSANSTESYASGHPSPAAAKLMSESNLSAADVTASGKDGRITKEDVLKAVIEKPAVAETSTSPVQVSTTISSFSRNIRREKMSRMRRTIATRLVSAKNNTAMLTTFNEVDLTEVMALRDKYQERFVAKYGIKLGFMSLFAKACAQALMEMPEVNAMIDGNDIVYHDYADISIAISTPTGLVVPPVHNVESLNFAEIEKGIKLLADKARSGKLTLEEMSGGTFTITNGGVFGSMMSTPIINEPQSAILGMHAIQQRPMAINGEVKIRPMMYLALSYDHRVIDGSSSVTFLIKVKKFLEDPMTLMMGI